MMMASIRPADAPWPTEPDQPEGAEGVSAPGVPGATPITLGGARYTVKKVSSLSSSDPLKTLRVMSTV